MLNGIVWNTIGRCDEGTWPVIEFWSMQIHGEAGGKIPRSITCGSNRYQKKAINVSATLALWNESTKGCLPSGKVDWLKVGVKCQSHFIGLVNRQTRQLHNSGKHWAADWVECVGGWISCTFACLQFTLAVEFDVWHALPPLINSAGRSAPPRSSK